MSFVKLKELDENLIYKKVKIRVSSSKSITTPIKATNHYNPVSEVNEIYRQFTLDQLREMSKDKSKDDKVTSSIKKEKTDDLNFFFVNYVGAEKPKDNDLETLMDTQHPYSDIIVPPLFSKLLNQYKEDKLLQNFITLTNKSLEITNTLNNKPIIGVIPAIMPRQFLKPIIRNYEKQGITSFVIDFNGRSIDTNMAWARTLMRVMSSYGLTDDSFLYGINCHSGRFIKQSSKILAKDFISMGLGIDILGLNHIGPRMSSEEWENLKNSREESLHRVFDRKNYAYIKTWDSELRGQIPGDIKMEIKRRTMETQYKESIFLREKLGKDNSLEQYIQSKDQVTAEIIGNMKVLRKEAFDHHNYKTLDLFE
jgi:hypothetical protein